MADTFEQLSAALGARYKLQRELGQGGMAKVYLAQDLKYQRAVAVKVLLPELAESVGAARFLQEIQIAARLHHPHILPLYDSDEVEKFLYYVMPYMEGESLRERLSRERQLPVGDAIQIAREVADALSYAHKAGVVHRDIKPEQYPARVRPRHRGGLRHRPGGGRGQRPERTAPHHVIGTPAYMSPEQTEGSEYLDGAQRHLQPGLRPLRDAGGGAPVQRVRRSKQSSPAG